MSLLEIESDVMSNCIKPKQVFALSNMAIKENIKCNLNCANQYIMKKIFAIKITGNANPKKANIQK